MHSVLPFLFYWLLVAKLAAPNSTLSSTTSTTLSNNITKPGCPSKCGDLAIPYPFGIGSNCSKNPLFNIHCNQDNSSTLILKKRSFPLVNISESEIQIKFTSPASRCVRPCGPWSHCTRGTTKSNRLTSTGCMHMTVLQGTSKQPHDDGKFASGCISYCSSNMDHNRKRSCPGEGCCQIPIPRGTQIINVSISDLIGQLSGDVTSDCTYSHLGQQDSFIFQTVPNVTARLEDAPVILDWTIGSKNCSEADKNSTTSACGDNTVCIDADPRIGGYHCRCLDGYEGNPYLISGCRDIDECSSNPCYLTGICTNTPGNYSCRCREGYLGDGEKDGRGCVSISVPKLNKISIGLISGSSFIALLSILFWLARFVKKRKNQYRKQKFFKQNGGLLLQQEKNQGIIGKTRIFTVKELQKATDNFNESRILGRGGQGTVYKGMLSDGKIVAIKKSGTVIEQKSEQVVEQFINEVVLLSQINHRNVVKLFGCCLEARIPLLVYEFMSNGTLFDMIHDKNMEFPISLKMRLKIALDIAGALAYLHSATSLPIFHRDVKSSNVLLDEKFVAKVSDFGISKSVDVDQTHITTNVIGTFGYIDPEYFQSHQLTDKSDVYSFGVVLVELLTGRKAIISSANAKDEKSLVWHFLSKMEDEENPDLVVEDMAVVNEDRKILLAAAKLAKRCLHNNGKERPSMKEVAIELEGIIASQVNLTNSLDGFSFHDDEQESTTVSTGEI